MNISIHIYIYIYLYIYMGQEGGKGDAIYHGAKLVAATPQEAERNKQISSRLNAASESECVWPGTH